MQEDDYKRVVLETIKALPQDYAEKLKDFQVTVEDRPPVQQIVHEQYSHKPEPVKFYAVKLPEKMVIYKSALLRISSTLEDARGHIKDAVIKEISNYFGISEFELRRIRNPQ